jgi:hypothetical protein
MADDNSLSNIPKQQLLDLINNDNGVALTLDQVTLSDPVPFNYANRNTKVTLTAKPDTAFANSKDFYYNRLALTRLGYVGVVSTEPISSEQFLQIVSTEKKIQLIADEFEYFTMPVLETGEVGKITLIAKPNAIKWFGQIEADYIFGVPAGLGLLHTLIHVTLPSEDYLV